MKVKVVTVAAALVAVVAAYAAQKGKCTATAKECEYQIRDMLSHKRHLGARVEESRWGVVVTHILPESPAAAAGLQVGDRVFAINGRECSRGGLKRYKTLLNEAATRENGRVTLTIVRLGRLHRLAARMRLMSKEEIDKVVATHLQEAHPELGN